MKKYLIPIIVLLCVSIAWAGNLQKKVIARKNATPPGCGGTQTFVGDPGDTESFEFEAADFCTTEFTETDPETIINTYDATQVKNGSHALSIAVSGENQEDNYVQANLGTADADFTMDFWYYLYNRGDWVGHYIASLTTTAPVADAIGVALRHVGADTVDTIVADGVVDDTSINLTSPAWYRIEIDYYKNNDTAQSTVKIYNTSDALIDTLNFTASNAEVQYFNFGCIFSTANTGTFYYDDVRYQSTAGGF